MLVWITPFQSFFLWTKLGSQYCFLLSSGVCPNSLLYTVRMFSAAFLFSSFCCSNEHFSIISYSWPRVMWLCQNFPQSGCCYNAVYSTHDRCLSLMHLKNKNTLRKVSTWFRACSTFKSCNMNDEIVNCGWCSQRQHLLYGAAVAACCTVM
jgi:hypothetical protein